VIAERAPVPGMTSQALTSAPRIGLTGLLWIAALSTVGFIWVVTWRPFGSAAALHNAVAAVLLGVMCLTFVASALMVSTEREWGLLALHVTLAGFLVRCIPILGVPYPTLHDGYFYYAALLNIVDGRSLDPTTRDWYSSVGQQLRWPVLHDIAAQLVQWTSVDSSGYWRFLPPALGALTFIAVGLLTEEVYGSWRFAALAGLLATFSDLVLSFQSEYHPQGLALVVFSFFVYLLIKSRSASGPGLRVLMLLIGAVFLFTHHLSSVVLPFMLVPLLLIPVVFEVLVKLGFGRGRLERLFPIPERTQVEIRRLWALGTAVTLLVVAASSFHFFFDDTVLRQLLASAKTPFTAPRNVNPVLPAELAGIFPNHPPAWWVSVLHAGKYFLMVPAFVGVLLVVKRPTSKQIIVVGLMGVLIVYSLAGIIATAIPSIRFLAFWYPIASVLAAAGLATIALKWRRAFALPVVVCMAAIYCAVGIVDQDVPAHIFENTPRTTGLWYGNAVPNMDRMALAGEWLRTHTPDDATYSVDFSTRTSPFFFARRSDRQIVFDPVDPRAHCFADYTEVDEELDQGGYLQPQIPVNYWDRPRIYDNGSIAIYAYNDSVGCGLAPKPETTPSSGAGEAES
jgi:hypothetical protein